MCASVASGLPLAEESHRVWSAWRIVEISTAHDSGTE